MSQDLKLPAHIKNYGQGAYVSTQELISLIRKLQGSSRPDIVILYSGYNDAVSAVNWPEVRGAHFQLDRISEKFEKNARPFIRSTGLYRAVDYLMLRLRQRGISGPRAAVIDPHRLGQQPRGSGRR